MTTARPLKENSLFPPLGYDLLQGQAKPRSQSLRFSVAIQVCNENNVLRLSFQGRCTSSLLGAEISARAQHGGAK